MQDLSKTIQLEPYTSSLQDQNQVNVVFNFNLPFYEETYTYDIFTELFKLESQGQDYERIEGFSNHREEHILQVCEKTLEAMKAFSDTLKYEKEHPNAHILNIQNQTNSIKYSDGIDLSVMMAAAFAHDTGMGHAVLFNNKGTIESIGKIDSPEKFDILRKNHPLNSAINVLTKRNEYKKIGFSDKQIDEIALLCMSHSKSTSGIRNLTKKEEWENCCSILKQACNYYNQINNFEDNKITADFDSLISNKEELEKIVLGSLALRIGDASRDAKAIDLTQNLDFSTAPDYQNAPIQTDIQKSPNEELKNNKLWLLGPNKERIKEITHEPTKTMRFGEQAIVENHIYFDEKTASIVHSCRLSENAIKCPFSVMTALTEHDGELNTAGGTPFTIKAEFDEDTLHNMTLSSFRLFERYRDGYKNGEYQNSEFHENIEVIFPWEIDDDDQPDLAHAVFLETKQTHYILGVTSNEQEAEAKKELLYNHIKNCAEKYGFEEQELLNNYKIKNCPIECDIPIDNNQYIECELVSSPSGQYYCKGIPVNDNKYQEGKIDIFGVSHSNNKQVICKIDDDNNLAINKYITQSLGIDELLIESVQNKLSDINKEYHLDETIDAQMVDIER